MTNSFNPLSILLTQNKLTGPNYIDWKRNLNIVLTAEDYKFVLTDLCPETPIERASDEESQPYRRWIKADQMARCYILGSMSNVLQHQHESMVSAYDIMMNLKEMFGDQDRAARQVSMKELMNTNMAEGTLVREHVLKMIGLLAELEILGAQIDGETQVDIVLQSLPDSFTNFRLNYNMNKRSYSLSELLKELQAAEGLLKKPSSVMVAVKSGSSKRFAKKKKKKTQAGIPRAGNATQGMAGGPKALGPQQKKAKGKCFKCGQKGHWKPQCPLLKNNAGISFSLVVESCLAVRSTGTWYVDSGATDHVCNSLQGFQETRQLSDGKIYLYNESSGSCSWNFFFMFWIK
jgi:gag-polypeptide of LTR copia-type/Zinc knuckle